MRLFSARYWESMSRERNSKKKKKKTHLKKWEEKKKKKKKRESSCGLILLWVIQDPLCKLNDFFFPIQFETHGTNCPPTT